MPVIGEINHRQLGRVVVSSRPNSRRATARWRNGLVSLNVPRHLGLPDINRLLDDFTPRLLASRPTLRYTAPSRISFPGVDFIIARQSVAPGKMLAKASLPACSLEIGTDFDLDDEATTRLASSLLCRMARKIAPEILLPAPASWPPASDATRRGGPSRLASAPWATARSGAAYP